MNTQSKALRLAGYWAAKNDQGEYLYSSLRFREETAAELRRLHAVNVLLHERHHFDNGVLKELLDALKLMLAVETVFDAEVAEDRARTVIAKVEGQV